MKSVEDVYHGDIWMMPDLYHVHLERDTFPKLMGITLYPQALHTEIMENHSQTLS